MASRARWLTCVAMLVTASVEQAEAEMVTVMYGAGTNESIEWSTEHSVNTGRTDDVQELLNSYWFRDTDNDLLLDREEVAIGTRPDLEDTDGDGLDDWTEHEVDLDPLSVHTWDQHIADGELDLDDDGFSNLKEQASWTNLADPLDYPGSPHRNARKYPGGVRWRKVTE